MHKRNAFPNLSAPWLTASHETILWAHTGGPKGRDYRFNYDAVKRADPERSAQEAWQAAQERGIFQTTKALTSLPTVSTRLRSLSVSRSASSLSARGRRGAGACRERQRDGRELRLWDEAHGFEVDPDYVALKTRRLQSALSHRERRASAPHQMVGEQAPSRSSAHALWPEVCSSARYFEPLWAAERCSWTTGQSGRRWRRHRAAHRALEVPTTNPDEVSLTTVRSGVSASAGVMRSLRGARAIQSERPLISSCSMCVNGLIRFNSKGHFNNPLHHTRPGIHPDRLASIVHAWRLCLATVSFQVADYEETLVAGGGSAFLDPPYAGTRGRYKPEPFDLERFQGVLERLNQRGAHWMPPSMVKWSQGVR